jgi:polyphosphate kinase 2
MQEWILARRMRLVVILEGRDTAGKGGTIKRVTELLNPRYCRVVALPAPNERERGEWYFQRYARQLPTHGEIVLFDRSWYNRAGVEHVLGFCTDEQYRGFLQVCPLYERTIVDNGIILIKYWFEVSQGVQTGRFQERVDDGRKIWKLSGMDLESHRRWYDFSRARDAMFAATDTDVAPWYVVNADDPRRARLNCISHLLSKVPYKEPPREPVKLGKRQPSDGYVEPQWRRHVVPELY